jgi:hypothetical protein
VKLNGARCKENVRVVAMAMEFYGAERKHNEYELVVKLNGA